MAASTGQPRPLTAKFPLRLKKFLINTGALRLRTIFRRLWWPVERSIFTTFRIRKKICVARLRKSETGLFACFIRIISGIAYAERKAMIPVVDMQTFQNAYLYENEVGSVNAWEYYFEQPAGISVNEALASESYEIRDTVLCPNPRQYMPLYDNQDGQLDYWRGICRKYIRFKPAVLERLERGREKFSGKKVLGVSLRGTDYTSLKPTGHPVQPDPEDVISKASEVMSKGKYDALYLSTEDKRIIAKFAGTFGDKLILPEGEYVDFDYNADKWITSYSTHRDNDKYIMGLEYLVSKLLLIECAGVIMTITSGTTAVMCLSEGFEYIYIFDLGVYD